jgi:rod shape-determining protein MreD
MTRTIKWWFFLGMGFYLCALLAIIPLPVAYQWARPEWVLMFVIFCQLNHPTSFNPLLAWVMGLFVDGLLGTSLGEHALVYAIICYITALLRPRFLFRPLWQQVGKISFLICLSQIGILILHALKGQTPHTWLYWLGTAASCVIWPMFVSLLHHLSHFLNVAPRSRSL